MMRKPGVTLLLGCLFSLAAHTAFAGAPLKGVDVKLGKNPGGTVAARVSGENGEINFGVVPKGNYSVTISATKLAPNARGIKPEKLHVEVRGSAQGPMMGVLRAASPETQESIEIVSDGKTPLVVTVSDGQNEPVDAVRVRSHSNSTNN